MSEYLDVIHGEMDNLRDIASELSRLSKAFYTTGNEKLGEHLYNLAGDALDASKNIGNAVSKDINSQCKNAQDSAFNTLAACLAMNGTDVSDLTHKEIN